MTEENKNLELKLWNKISATYVSLEKKQSRLLANYKLTSPQFHVLETLKNYGPLPLNKISEKLMVTGANITCVIDNLEKANLVKRVHSKKDRRVITAELTEIGKQQIKKVFPEYLSQLGEMIKSLTDNEKKQLIRLTKKLVV